MPEKMNAVDPPARAAGRKVGYYLAELRAPFLLASVIPVGLGAALARAHTGRWDWPLFLWTLAGVACLHAGANVANDYYDHRSGNDEANTDFVRPFTGGSRLIQNGSLTPREVAGLAVACLLAGGLIGLYLTWQAGLAVLALGLIGLAGGVSYSAPPVNLAARGLGELAVALNFGILPVAGSYYVQARRFDAAVIGWALPLACLIVAVLWINQFQDYRADLQVGKRHGVVLRLSGRVEQRDAARRAWLWALPPAGRGGRCSSSSLPPPPWGSRRAGMTSRSDWPPPTR